MQDVRSISYDPQILVPRGVTGQTEGNNDPRANLLKTGYQDRSR